MPKKQRPKNNTARFIFLAIGSVVVLVLVGVVTNWQWHWLGGEPAYETPAVNADYLPPDTVAVLHVNLREVQDSKYVSKEFQSLLSLVYQNLPTAEMRQHLGVDLREDVDWVRLAVTASDGANPLVILSGRFDPAKFKPTKDGPLRQVNRPGDRHRLYELPAPKLEMTFTLAPAGDLLLMCGKPAPVTDALRHAGEAPPPLEDAKLAELLTKVDRSRSIWGAASLKKWKPAPLNVFLVGAAVKTVIDNTEGVYGGVTCGDAVEGTVYFLTAAGGKAAEVEQALDRLCALAKGFGLVVLPDWRGAVVKIVGAGEVKRNGDTVVLRCRLPPPPK
jgi:hypothetical protein